MNRPLQKLSLLSWTGAVLLAACGGISIGAPETGARAPEAGARADGGGSGGGPFIDAAPVAGDTALPSGLAAPWQYHDEPQLHEYKDPSLPAGVRGLFGGAAAAEGWPVIVYPLAGSVHPTNVLLLTIQWQRGAASSTVFMIEARSGLDRYLFYVPCTDAAGRCAYAMPMSEWQSIGQAHAGQAVTITVRGTDGKGGPVASSAPIQISMSSEPVLGGLYVWAASIGTIRRTAFGGRRYVDYVAPLDTSLGLGNATCVGCHSVSRDGKKLAFAVTSLSTDDKPWGIFVLPTDDPKHALVAPPMNDMGVVIGSFGSIAALNSDGSLMAVNGVETGETLFLDVRTTSDAANRTVSLLTGDPAFRTAGYDMGILPEWSPDGTALAVTLTVQTSGDMCSWDHVACNGTIARMRWNGSTLSPAVPLVRSAPGHETELHFYPTWSPDGRWIAFVSLVGRLPDAGTNTWDTGGRPNPQSYDAKNGVLRMVPSDLAGAPYTCPGPQCIELLAATQYGWAEALADAGKGSTYPRFAPLRSTDGTMFLSFTSRMDYGFVSGDIHQIWLSAIDVNKIAAGADPSSPPIWVPYQDIGTQNTAPSWATTLYCTKSADGTCNGCVEGERCMTDQSGECYCDSW